MYYVYFLKNMDDERIYIGFSRDLRRRLSQHKAKDKNWQLVYYEAYLDEKDARIREKKLKHYGASLGHLKSRIYFSLEDLKERGRSVPRYEQ